ncbi:MerR family transcriptional regulator [Sneathiella chinensis]|uniref:Transcriptional regulator n=1 Tax=Sneathiella chinensis TaxID=349750 RepID=A0ABQ5U4Z0_9PROT|nr:helix-turn-helix domain-containing protein [Sneathiella chinensis]GLQ05546.1 transcriptional regulator [Sneathiella chinensis]
MFSIGDMSKQSGVKVPTIRYYEQIGLISPRVRSEGNQRRYGERERDQLVFIKHARDLGLHLNAIRELLELDSDPEKPCLHADELAREHLAGVRKRIGQLQKLERELERISDCKGDGTVRECYVLQSLSDHGTCETEHRD